jgi:hypothetical protein
MLADLSFYYDDDMDLITVSFAYIYISSLKKGRYFKNPTPLALIFVVGATSLYRLEIFP